MKIEFWEEKFVVRNIKNSLLNNLSRRDKLYIVKVRSLLRFIIILKYPNISIFTYFESIKYQLGYWYNYQKTSFIQKRSTHVLHLFLPILVFWYILHGDYHYIKFYERRRTKYLLNKSEDFKHEINTNIFIWTTRLMSPNNNF